MRPDNRSHVIANDSFFGVEKKNRDNILTNYNNIIFS